MRRLPLATFLRAAAGARRRLGDASRGGSRARTSAALRRRGDAAQRLGAACSRCRDAARWASASGTRNIVTFHSRRVSHASRWWSADPAPAPTSPPRASSTTSVTWRCDETSVEGGASLGWYLLYPPKDLQPRPLGLRSRSVDSGLSRSAVSNSPGRLGTAARRRQSAIPRLLCASDVFRRQGDRGIERPQCLGNAACADQRAPEDSDSYGVVGIRPAPSAAASRWPRSSGRVVRPRDPEVVQCPGVKGVNRERALVALACFLRAALPVHCKVPQVGTRPRRPRTRTARRRTASASWRRPRSARQRPCSTRVWVIVWHQTFVLAQDLECLGQ